MDYYGLFDVPRTASVEEIHRAYQVRARLVHPDRHAGAPPDAVATATRRMAELNEAWAVLSDPDRRSAYDRTLGRPGGTSTPRTVREPQPDECVLCGSTPATAATLRSQTGLVFATRRTAATGPFCRCCGLALFRRLTNRSLVRGWWGILSVFTNWWTLARNAATAELLRALDEPRRRSGDIATPLSRPLDPGRGLLRRSGIYLVVALVSLGLAVVYLSTRTPSTDQGPRGGTELSQYEDRCLDLTADRERIVRAVDCNGAQDARVVAIVGAGHPCPRPADAYFVYERSGQRLCVTTTGR